MSKLRNDLAVLKAEQLAILDALDKVEGIARRKYSRDAARDGRAARKEEKSNGLPDPEKYPDEWKRAIAKQHALGRIKT